MTDYNGAEQAMIDLWVQEKLETHTDFDSISPGLTSRIFNWYAPSGTAYPYIIFNAQSTPEVVRGVGDAEVMVSTIYTVKAIAQGPDFEALAPVASAIRAALVSANGETITGGVGSIFTCHFERQVAITQAESDEQFRQLGGEFTIQAQAA